MKGTLRIALASWVALVAVLALAAEASAENSDSGFGVVPGFRIGPNFGQVVDVDALQKVSAGRGSRGWMLEPHVDGLFTKSRFGVGASLGYVFQSLGVDEGSRIETGTAYEGVTMTPFLMFELVPRVVLVGKGGLVLGTLSDGLADDVGSTGYRVGGQLMFFAYRNAGADVTISIDFMHTEASATYPGGTGINYSANAIALDSTFSFFADMLDL